MKQYTFKDGSIITASTAEEAIKKHKATSNALASAEMRQFSYKGQLITAETKQDAIAQIITAAKSKGPFTEKFFKDLGFKKEDYNTLSLNNICVEISDDCKGFELSIIKKKDIENLDYISSIAVYADDYYSEAEEKGFSKKEIENLITKYNNLVIKWFKDNISKLKKVSIKKDIKTLSKFPEFTEFLESNKKKVTVKDVRKKLLSYGIKKNRVENILINYENELLGAIEEGKEDADGIAEMLLDYAEEGGEKYED